MATTIRQLRSRAGEAIRGAGRKSGLSLLGCASRQSNGDDCRQPSTDPHDAPGHQVNSPTCLCLHPSRAASISDRSLSKSALLDRCSYVTNGSNLDFVRSSGVGEGVYEAGVQFVGDFFHVGVWHRH